MTRVEENKEQYYKDLAESYEKTITKLAKAIAEQESILDRLRAEIKKEDQKQKCESCFIEKLTKEKQASAKDCKKCKHFTDTDEVHGYTPCGSCGADLRNFESKQADTTDGDEIKAGDEVRMKGMVKKAYQAGLEDAWECARQIHDMYYQELNEVFPDSTHNNIFIDYSAQEAMQKIMEYKEQQKQDEKYYMPIGEENMLRKRELREQVEKCKNCAKEISAECVVDGCEYEEKQPDDEIGIGDEIRFLTSGTKAVIFDVGEDNELWVLNEEGDASVVNPVDIVKTGKHIGSIAKILKQLRGEKE